MVALHGIEQGRSERPLYRNGCSSSQRAPAHMLPWPPLGAAAGWIADTLRVISVVFASRASTPSCPASPACPSIPSCPSCPSQPKCPDCVVQCGLEFWTLGLLIVAAILCGLFFCVGVGCGRISVLRGRCTSPAQEAHCSPAAVLDQSAEDTKLSRRFEAQRRLRALA